MDLSSIMNQGDASQAKPAQGPNAPRTRPPLTAAGFHQSTSNFSHGPSPTGSFYHNSPNSTPLQSVQLPSQGYSPSQTPRAPSNQPYLHHNVPGLPASLSRASSYNQTFPQSLNTHQLSPAPPQSLASGRPSHSPASSFQSQTSHSIRQSPLPAAVAQPYSHYPAPSSYSTQSQPGTPLAPPFLPGQRQSGSVHPDTQSPSYRRTMSGNSNEIISQSPTQHHLNVGNLVESPLAQQRPVPTLSRNTSDHLSQLGRERSISVSPKTRVPLRPSLSSAHSSQQGSYSARSSVQPSRPVLNDATPSHSHSISSVMNESHAQSPRPSSQTNLNADPSLVRQPLQAQSRLTMPSHAVSPVQLHQVQKLDMNQLLSSPTGSLAVEAQAHEAATSNVNGVKAANHAMGLPTKGVHLEHNGDEVKSDAHIPLPRTPLKRAADADLRPEQFTVKRSKTRAYTERPIWARIAPHNPRVDRVHPHPHSQSVSLSGRRPTEIVARTPKNDKTPSVNGPHPVTSSQSREGVAISQPWLAEPPLDVDLIRARQLLGSWEKTIKWVTPCPDMVMAVQDWLFRHLSALGDVGNDPLEGAVEIEAKIGHIISKQNDQRLHMPLLTASVLDPSVNDNIRFESQMDERAHSAMNRFLNATIQSSMTPGRVRMHYEHPRETDSFRVLSPAGLQALPTSFQRRPAGRDLRLRTTIDSKTGKVTARIVKVHVADLHIYNPTGDYDCRITINLEANLNRPDLAPFTHLVIEPSGEKPAAPDRKKDRLSYKHLAYSIDLTKVEMSNTSAAKHELELEVDAKLLREQMQLLASGDPNNAFGDIVSGFLDNATFLMRLRMEG